MNQVQEYTPASPPPPLLLSPTPDGLGLPPPPRLKPTLDLLPTGFTRADKNDSVQAVPTGALFPPTHLHNSSSSPSTPTTPTSPDNSAPPSMSHVGTRSQCSLQPYLLANRYLITRSLDSSTSEAVHLPSRTSLIIKCLPTRTAKEVCSQHSLLGEVDGIRPPLELIEGSDSLSWLVIAPHHGDLHSYVRSRKRIREVEAQRLFSQVAGVVDRCHSTGLVLRDLKLRKFVFTDVNRYDLI
ncbi:Protein kinase-like domain [Trinorchestia longiramus]|nr:Protein kinase-like domain [Trinorchestia longiramus]